MKTDETRDRHRQSDIEQDTPCACRRALADRSTNRGSEAELTPATKDKLLWLGHTRAMIYRVLMFTLNPAVESLGIRQKGGQSGRKWDSPSGVLAP